MTKDFNALAKDVALSTHQRPVLVPLDTYNISSELSYYQEKLLAAGQIQTAYPILGRHIFGLDSLMYRYWAPKQIAPHQVFIVISTHSIDLNDSGLKERTRSISPVNAIWAYSQKGETKMAPYYYQVVITRDTY